MTDIIAQLNKFRRQRVMPLSDQLNVPSLADAVIGSKPLILLLGNHSSGKSSMINYLLQENIQRTSVAPTDDGFTILHHGPENQIIDGNSLCSDPDLPFTDLQRFGPGLLQHCKGHTLNNPILEELYIIDSPGMIDAIGNRLQTDRPYDFEGVVRWFAQRCDLILLFFDPEKPGTTGETLSTLTSALSGIDNKLRIVMNKMDLFTSIRDFARTYGALCWNLSRHLNTKDIPHIYTTVVPGQTQPDPRIPLRDFHLALEELRENVIELPDQRLYSAINQSELEMRRLHMHGTIARSIQQHMGRVSFSIFMLLFIIAAIGGFIAYLHYQPDAWFESFLWAFGSGLILLSWLFLRKPLHRIVEQQDLNNLDKVFHQTYHRPLQQHEHTEDMKYMWEQVRPQFERSVMAQSLSKTKSISNGQLRRLRKVLDHELPLLRKSTKKTINEMNERRASRLRSTFQDGQFDEEEKTKDDNN